MQPSTGATAGGAVRRVADRPLVALALAALGVAVGHALTYLVLVPNATERAVVLQRTGHGYLSAFTQAATVLGAIGAAAVVLGSLGRGRRSVTAEPVTFRGLASLQVVAFVWMEIAERVASHAGFGGLLRADLALGVVVQVVIAAVLAAAIARLRRVAVAIALEPAGVRPPRPVAPVVPVVPPPPAIASARVAPPPRGPPSVSLSPAA
jgi:hypothetical protein